MPASVFIPSGAGAPGFGGILELLLQAGYRVCAGDKDPNAYGRGLVADFSVMPASGDPGYIDAVITAAKKFNCNVVLPITTGELIPLAQNESRLKSEGILMAISPAESLEKANNKRLLLEFLERGQLKVPAWKVANTRDEVLKAARDLGYPQKDVFLKPAVGNGSRGIRLLTTVENVKRSWIGAKAGSILCSAESLPFEMPDTLPHEYLVMEYLPGQEYSVDMMCWKGELQNPLIRTRDKTVSGISVSGTFVANEKISEMCEIVAAGLGLHGPIGMQFKENVFGEPMILEINPRLQGAVSACMIQGANFPAWAVKMAIGWTDEEMSQPKEEITNEILPTYPTRFGRYWKDVPL